jgi:quercetin dioxygenase-like cupin family protein
MKKLTVLAVALLASFGAYAANVELLPPYSDLINGQPIPMKPVLAESVRVMDLTVDGKQHIVNRDTRPAGTRAPVHIHPYGGSTCVMQGQMTLYMDGFEPVTKKAGECYWMPHSHRMSGVNTGTETAIMFDSFIVPVGAPTWQVVEPGMSGHKH